MKTGGAPSLAAPLTALPATVLAAVLAAPTAALAAPQCSAPAYPLEARRYELEGVTTLRYRLAPDGRAKDIEVAGSSGWKLLDEATVRSMQACVATPAQAARARGAALSLKYVWDLEGDRVRPHLLAGSCPATAYFTAFQPYADAPSDQAGIKVRLLVDLRGKPFGVKPEGGHLAPRLSQALVTYVESCRFGFNPAMKGERTDTAYGRVVFAK